MKTIIIETNLNERSIENFNVHKNHFMCSVGKREHECDLSEYSYYRSYMLNNGRSDALFIQRIGYIKNKRIEK